MTVRRARQPRANAAKSSEKQTSTNKKASGLASGAKLRKGTKGPIQKLKLKNGLSVLLMENHKSPVVSVQMWVKTGSADERRGEEGISHFIEHLVFKGTDKYGVGEIASSVESAGGELNAYTSFDQTVFYVNISKEFSEVALDVIAEMMGFPKFDQKEVDNEREVVIEEIKRSNDSPGRQASRLLFSTVYKTHPYGIPVIGYDRIIREVSHKTLVDYYRSRYVPSNMHLVVAGDFDGEQMAQRVHDVFGRLPIFKLRKVARRREHKQLKPRIKVSTAPFEEAQFHLSWRIPGAAHKDIPALDVLALILGQGDSSRLAQKLRMEKPLTTSIGAGTFTPKEDGIFTVSGALNPEQLAPALQALAAELLRLCEEPPSADEIKKAIVNFESDEFYAMETIEGVARKAGSFENLMGDYAYFQKFLKMVYSLTPDDLLRVARKYLAPQAMSFVMMTPRAEKETSQHLRSWIRAYEKNFARAKKSRPKSIKKARLSKVKWAIGAEAAEKARVEKHQLASGARVLFGVSRATPVVSVKAGFLGGTRFENGKQGGLTELVSRVWTSGTRALSESEIQTRIEQMAGGLSGFSGRNSAGLSMQTLSPFEADGIDLFSEILVSPEISDSVVEREKVLMLEAIRSREDSPGQIVSQLFTETMFKGHPYERDLLGTNESVERLSRSDVDGYLRGIGSARNLTVAICGDVDRDNWLSALESATARLSKKPVARTQFSHSGPTEILRSFRSLDREQTHIMIGYKGLTLSDPRRFTLQVMQSILAGQGGRLFIELRDKASLAYSVAPLRMEGVDTGYFGGYIACSPGKGEKAIEMLRHEFARLVETPVGDAELERAKRYLIGRHDIDLQRNSAISSSILFNEIYGIDAEEMYRYAANLRGITASDIRNLAEEIFRQPYVACAVGRERPW